MEWLSSPTFRTVLLGASLLGAVSGVIGCFALLRRQSLLGDAMAHEREALGLYRQLLKEVEGKSVMMEEYARGKVLEEETHLGEVDKMLRQPGDIETFAT